MNIERIYISDEQIKEAASKHQNEGHDTPKDSRQAYLSFIAACRWIESESQNHRLADIARHTVGKEGFDGNRVGGTIYCFNGSKFDSITLSEGDILNRKYCWLTQFEFNCIVKQILEISGRWASDDHMKEAYNKGYRDGHSDGVLYDMPEYKEKTLSFDEWLETYKLEQQPKL